MGLFSKQNLSLLPQIPLHQETTFYVSGKKYWLGMTVKESGLQFQKEKDAHRKLKPNQNTQYADWWMYDEYGNEFLVGFVNRGITTIEFKDAEIAFFAFDVSLNVKKDQILFFENLHFLSNLPTIKSTFKRYSSFEHEMASDDCIIFKGEAVDISFKVDLWEVLEVQLNSYIIHKSQI